MFAPYVREAASVCLRVKEAMCRFAVSGLALCEVPHTRTAHKFAANTPRGVRNRPNAKGVSRRFRLCHVLLRCCYHVPVILLLSPAGDEAVVCWFVNSVMIAVFPSCTMQQCCMHSLSALGRPFKAGVLSTNPHFVALSPAPTVANFPKRCRRG